MLSNLCLYFFCYICYSAFVSCIECGDGQIYKMTTSKADTETNATATTLTTKSKSENEVSAAPVKVLTRKRRVLTKDA